MSNLHSAQQLSTTSVSTTLVDDLDTQDVIRHFRALADAALDEECESDAPVFQPSTWGPFEIIREIGRGGYGAVYLAWDSTLERAVALKLLHHADRASAAVREARLLALAAHPNVVGVLGADTHDGLLGLWMEYIEGATLQAFLKKSGALAAHDALAIGIHLAYAIAAVHKAGLIHRDIKVHNVMREDRTGRIVLMDFGSSVVRTDDVDEIPDLVGTPCYIAPELLAGSPATVASDIYSLGVVLYHLVTLDFPLRDPAGAESDAPDDFRFVPLSDRRPDLPAAFVHVVSRALAIDPADRYESVNAMQEDLVHAVSVTSALSLSLSRSSRRSPREPLRRGPARRSCPTLPATHAVRRSPQARRAAQTCHPQW
jgi:eukaryotic-like serine/threonine-protein kinase